MAPGRFTAMVGMLVWRRSDGRYLLLRRSESRDYGAGEWESCSGRLEQGEGFVQALGREAREELGLDLRVECILGATHFYRGAAEPGNETVGVSFGCSADDGSGLALSDEHSEHRWATAEEAATLLPPGHWLNAAIERADAFRTLMPVALSEFYRRGDFEL